MNWQRNLHRVDGLRQVYVDGMLPHNEANLGLHLMSPRVGTLGPG